MVLKDGYLYEIANVVTRSHERFVFSGCRLCSVMRFQRRPWFSKTIFFTRLQRQPVLFLHEISLTASLVRSRDLTGGQRSVAVGSVLSCDF